MKKTCLNKLQRAGFTILRCDFFRLQIKIRNSEQAWAVFEKGFSSRAALSRRMKELLEDERIIEDM